jgi:choline kinase
MTALPAVILAAGCGKRMGEEGTRRPKTLTPIGGSTIADTLFEGLLAAGFVRAVVVTGHLSAMLEAYLERYRRRIELVFVNNPDYATTNNMYSLWLARNHLARGFCLFEADVWCEPAVVAGMMGSPHENVMVVDEFTGEMNGTVVSLRPDGSVERMVMPAKTDPPFDCRGMYKTVNFYRLGKGYVRDRFMPGLNRAVDEGDINSYYEKVIRNDIEHGVPFHAFKTGGLKWWEIDTPGDAVKAAELAGGSGARPSANHT